MLVKNYISVSLEETAADIVRKDYRTAAVFKEYGIDFCCGVRWPLKNVCETKELNPEKIKKDLQDACRNIQVSNRLPFDSWGVDFLADYIVKVHHDYLKLFLPQLQLQLEKFVQEHKNKFPELADLASELRIFCDTMHPHLKQEEEIIFPYLRQIAHAYESQETYAGLLVRTLRKPVESLMHQEHEVVESSLKKFRSFTNHYTVPVNACTSHHLSFAMLKELDEDMVQHLYLENSILFPKALAMEKELLKYTP